MPFEITKSFVFDAAHQLAANVPDGHMYAGLHGHSFEVTVAFGGEPGAETGWIADFAEIEAVLMAVRARLDHKYLNEIDGLERPTLERIAAWLWDQIKPALPSLVRVHIARGSCREGCTYTGP